MAEDEEELGEGREVVKEVEEPEGDATGGGGEDGWMKLAEKVSALFRLACDGPGGGRTSSSLIPVGGGEGGDASGSILERHELLCLGV